MMQRHVQSRVTDTTFRTCWRQTQTRSTRISDRSEQEFNPLVILSVSNQRILFAF
jgi:hypothetical protein